MAATNNNVFDIGTGATKATAPTGIIGAQMQQVTAPDTTNQVAQINTGTFNPAAGTAERAGATGYNMTTAGYQGYNPATAESTGYTAAQRSANLWTPDANQTVEGRTAGLLSAGNPLLEKALADTRQDAASRGLLNSSMAAGAGRAAVLDKALQIATPDAQTFANAGQFNATAQNQAGADNQGATNRAAEFGANATNTALLTNRDAINRAGEFGAAAGNTATLANQASADRANQFGAAAINAASSQNAQASNALQQSQLDRTLQASNQNAQAFNSAVSQTAQMQQQAALANQQQAAQAALTQYDGALKVALSNADADNKLLLTQLDGQIKSNLASIEANFKTQMQTSQSAATMYSQAMESIAKIMTDQNLDAGAKQNLINQQMGTLQNGLKLQSSIAQIPGLDAILSSINQTAPAGAAVTAQPGTSGPLPTPTPNAAGGGTSEILPGLTGVYDTSVYGGGGGS